MQAYKREVTQNYSIGDLEKSNAGKYKLFNVETKPKGSNSNFVSIGKLLVKEDEFGDILNQWEHLYFPKDFPNPNIFKYKGDWDGKGNQTTITHTFLVDPEFINMGYAIALIGTGQGGRGFRDESLQIILDSERIKKSENI